MIEPDTESVRSGGDRWLARALLDGLHKALFGVRVKGERVKPRDTLGEDAWW